METVVTQDVLAVAVPAGLDVTDVAGRESLLAVLDALAVRTVGAQWDGADARPVRIEQLHATWLVTGDPAKVEAFQPAHDCAACRAGNDQAVAFLAANPGRAVALANLTYTEVWD